MQAQPLSKVIYDKAKILKIKKIYLAFSGGSDEGYLTVSFRDQKNKHIDEPEFESEIEDWAWEVYDYSGAGDGNDYGDDITYDLAANTVETSEWCMERRDSTPENDKLEVVD